MDLPPNGVRIAGVMSYYIRP